MKVAIFQTNLKIGGIQRSLLSMLKSEVFNSHSVDLFLTTKEQDYCINDLPNNVTVREIRDFPRFYKAVPFTFAYRLAVEKASRIEGTYDLAIDFDGYSFATAFYSIFVKANKKVIWIHSDYYERMKYDKKFALMLYMFKNKYRFFDRFVAVSKGAAFSASRLFGLEQNRISIIPNWIAVNDIKRKSQNTVELEIPSDKVNIICVGRLDRAKNPIGAVKDFEKAILMGADSRLYFLGKGSQGEAIEKYIKSKGLENRVKLLGEVKNPYPYIARMDALLLDSLYEGQGVVLREAQSLGLNLVFPKRLEKYNEGLKGVEDVPRALYDLKKRVRNQDFESLDKYNRDVYRLLKKMLVWAEYGRTEQ